MQGRLWNRGAVNMTPLRTWSHCWRIHRTGRTGHLCLWKNRSVSSLINYNMHQQFEDLELNLTLTPSTQRQEEGEAATGLAGKHGPSPPSAQDSPFLKTSF